MKWIKRGLLAVLVLVVGVVGIGVVATLMEDEKPAATMAVGGSKVAIYGRFDSLSQTSVPGGTSFTLNGRHRVQLVSSGELTVNDVSYGRDFSTAEIRLESDGSLATTVSRNSD